jgi:hypothetical protein
MLLRDTVALYLHNTQVYCGQNAVSGRVRELVQDPLGSFSLLYVYAHKRPGNRWTGFNEISVETCTKYSIDVAFMWIGKF